MISNSLYFPQGLPQNYRQPFEGCIVLVSLRLLSSVQSDNSIISILVFNISLSLPYKSLNIYIIFNIYKSLNINKIPLFPHFSFIQKHYIISNPVVSLKVLCLILFTYFQYNDFPSKLFSIFSASFNINCSLLQSFQLPLFFHIYYIISLSQLHFFFAAITFFACIVSSATASPFIILPIFFFHISHQDKSINSTGALQYNTFHSV